MNEGSPKIKKYGSYLLMGIGGLTVLVFLAALVWQFLSGPGLFAPRYESGSGAPRVSKAVSTGYEVAMEGAPLPASEVFQGESEGQLAERKVIKNASLNLLVKKVEESAESIKAVAARFAGIVVKANIWEVSKNIQSGTVTIKVPAEKFEEAVSEIKKLAVKVEREEINARDVTEEFVDLTAQLKNLRAEEAQYLKIMEQAKAVKDVLSVAQQLGQVRGNIERMEGKLKFLSRQVEMSTITTALTEEADVEVFGIRWRPLFVVKQSFRDMMEGLTGFVDALIQLFFKLPIILLWLATIGVIAILGWRLIRWSYFKYIKR